MKIVEFLEARITEDQSIYDIAAVFMEGFDEDPTSEGRIAQARELREIAAKRAILERADKMWGDEADQRYGAGARDDYFLDEILRPLAAVYSDHPDYDPTWASA